MRTRAPVRLGRLWLPVVLWLAFCTALGFAGGVRQLREYEPSPAAADLLAEYERAVNAAFMSELADPNHASDVDEMLQWRARFEEVREDRAAYHYLHARVLYDANYRTSGSAEGADAGYLDLAFEHILRFLDEKVRFADGYALHGAILGQKIAAEPANVMLYARMSKRALATALRLDRNNQLAHLALAFNFYYPPEEAGGDLRLAARHFAKALAGDTAPLRAVAGVWLSVTYDQLGDTARAVEAIQQVLDFAPGFPLAEATARALADGADPFVYWERLRADGE